ncbi:hypothetical protein [Streptomyces sp. NPDC005209]|uniref:hypothetical protein n=1 Tax=Streptomyces sp. NPDC005209 TaxID=3156715 RepID=UPI0033B5CED3
MPRGRHRHSPPLHRLLPPSAIAGVSLVCALGPWVFSEQTVLRSLAAAAAATAVIGAVVMRRWDTHAGKHVADLTRARASDEWRYEERVAELETDLEESRELRGKLEQRLRAKRAELAGLRNEHAALLRRYATAETERASALEGRRLLEIEATTPSRALPPAPRHAEPTEAGAVAAAADAETGDAEATGAAEAEATDAAGAVDAAEAGETGASAADESAEEQPAVPDVFSPEGSRLFLRAQAALSRFDGNDGNDEDGNDENDENDENDGNDGNDGNAENTAVDEGGKVVDEGDAAAKGEGAGDPVNGASAAVEEPGRSGPSAEPAGQEPAEGSAAADSGQEDEAQGQPEAVDGHEHAAADIPTASAPAAAPAQQPTGHFTVPTAVAVVPAAPVRRPVVEGGFDFFGTQKEEPSAALDAVQNEDLADVVGQEALALHKAESEAEFKPADEESRAVGQVIDLTAHDETEQIDLQGLRSAAS